MNEFTPYNNYQPYYGQRPHNNMDWIFAATVKQVEQINVQPGQKAWVMVQNEPVFALRVADQMGLISTTYYRFERYDPEEKTADSRYITRDELDKRLAELTTALMNHKEANDEPFA